MLLTLLRQVGRRPSSAPRRWAREIDGQVRKGFERSSRQSRRQVLWHLRQYRHATLDVSWLDERRWKSNPSAFEFALGASDRTPAGLGSLRQVPLADAATAKVAETMLCRVARAISELGYEAFVSVVCADDMLGGPFSPLGALAVDLLTPNRHVSATAQSNVILGVTNGHDQGQKGDWPAILETVLRRLEAHTTGPAVAVVISEGWDADAWHALCRSLPEELESREPRFPARKRINCAPRWRCKGEVGRAMDGRGRASVWGGPVLRGPAEGYQHPEETDK